MGSFENRACPFVSITVYDNPSKCISGTLEFAHVKTRQTSEERIAIVKVTTHPGICRQDSNLICQILSTLSEIIYLNKTSLSNIVDMIND